jgi:hypothetical protein
MSIPIISAYPGHGFFHSATNRERRHPLAAGKRGMLDCSSVSVERIPAGAAVESRSRQAAAAPV